MFNNNDSNNDHNLSANKNTANINIDDLDLKLILAFTNAYERLNARGEISEEQFSRVLEILDHYQSYTEAEVRAELKEIFPEND